MMITKSELLRNIAISGHGSTGKTSLLEAILFTTGRIPKTETLDSGKTVSDFTDEEISRKISIHTALASLMYSERKLNLLDTPGATDFVGELIAGLRAAESSLLLVAAEVGVQIGTIKTWRILEQRQTPRLAFINRMDKEHSSFEKALADLKDKFKASFIPLTIPLGEGAEYKGVIDLISEKAYLHQGEGKPESEGPLPPEAAERVKKHRQTLVEAAAEGDDALMEKFFAEEKLSSEEIILGLSRGLKARKIVPVFCGAATLCSGIKPCLDLLVALAPPPGGTVKALNGENQEIEVAIDSSQPASGFIFKTTIDQFAGKLSFAKIYTGTVTSETDLISVRDSKKEKIGKVFTCLGKKIEEVEGLAAGDIGLFAKLQTVMTNDTLSSPDRIVSHGPLKLLQPVHAVAISAAAKKDEDKLNQFLQRAAEEDPTFQITYNKETKETVIAGMGELHLNIILEKIKANQKIEMETRLPKVAYRETITTGADAEYQHKKQTGGHGQYAKVALEIAPLPRGGNFTFTNAVFGGAISKNYIPGVEKGVLEGMESGILAGYPVVDLEAKVIDGKMHPVDSSELAFKLAGRGALKAAMEKAKPVLLEPIMNLTVFVDDQYLGDVLSDLSSRRGRVLGQEPIGGGIQEIKAQVPQAELLRYSVDLKAITSGSASFEVEFNHYSPITGRLAEDVIKAAQASKVEAEN